MRNLIPNTMLKYYCKHGLSNMFWLFPPIGGYRHNNCSYVTQLLLLAKKICLAPFTQVSQQELARCHSRLGISCREISDIGVS